MTPQGRGKIVKTAVFRHRWQAWQVVRSIAAVRQRPRTPRNWRCSFTFSSLSFDISMKNSVERWSSDIQGLFRVKIRKMALGSNDLSTLPLIIEKNNKKWTGAKFGKSYKDCPGCTLQWSVSFQVNGSPVYNVVWPGEGLTCLQCSVSFQVKGSPVYNGVCLSRVKGSPVSVPATPPVGDCPARPKTDDGPATPKGLSSSTKRTKAMRLALLGKRTQARRGLLCKWGKPTAWSLRLGTASSEKTETNKRE